MVPLCGGPAQRFGVVLVTGAPAPSSPLAAEHTDPLHWGRRTMTGPACARRQRQGKGPCTHRCTQPLKHTRTHTHTHSNTLFPLMNAEPLCLLSLSFPPSLSPVSLFFHLSSSFSQSFPQQLRVCTLKELRCLH